MTTAPIRRAQLIAPFGVGALNTAPNGTSMITGGLDEWFESPDGNPDDIDLDEYRISEWRLEAALKVNHFRLPPDFRTWKNRGGERPKNLRLNVPALRFPLWHFCSRCRSLQEVPSHRPNRVRCRACEERNAAEGNSKKSPFLAQVPFVAVCQQGHLQDFPWREWVHRSASTSCTRRMRLRATGGASLAAQNVECDCGVPPRNLSSITDASQGEEGKPGTFLTNNLEKGAKYECLGKRPWLGDNIGQGCGAAIQGSLRAATNVYFGHVESAIYLPGGTLGIDERLLEVLEQAPLANTIAFANAASMSLSAALLRNDVNARLLGAFSDEDVDAALAALDVNSASSSEAAEPGDEVDPQRLRRPEFEVLCAEIDSKDLKISTQDIDMFDGSLGSFFTRINLVDQLRETRALYGFSRIRPDGIATLSERKRTLWRDEPEFRQSWLPAYIVQGEGLFFEFDEIAIQAWESQSKVQDRVGRLADHPDRTRVHRGLADRTLVARYVMLHSFAHLMINQLVFECGYSSASLRERVYCANGANPMAGVLIYTAAGDSEGTMGGLVRMGKPDYLEPALVAALDRARWCSSDPVCMELGARGQGPGAMNLAACHSCGLLPETACEVFNKFLDRALVTGTHDDPTIGFFSGSAS